MALKVLPEEELRELLLRIGRKFDVLKDLRADPSLVDLIPLVLADIKLAGSQSLPDSFYNRLDDMEAKLQKLLDDSKRKKTEAA